MWLSSPSRCTPVRYTALHQRRFKYSFQYPHDAPHSLLHLNGHAPGYAFAPDAEIGAAASHLDGAGVVPAPGQQEYRLLPAGAQENSGVPLLDVEGAGEFYRVPGLPIQGGAAEDQLRAGKVLITGLLGTGIVVLA